MAIPALAAQPRAESPVLTIYPVTSAPTGALATAAIAESPSGTSEVFELSKGAGSDATVWSATPSGTLSELASTGTGSGTPEAIVTADGLDWAASDGPSQLTALGSTGTALASFSYGGDLNDLTVGSGGDLYASDNSGNIVQFAVTGGASPTATPTTFADTKGAMAPDAITSAGGQLWLSDDLNNLVSMTTAGVFGAPDASDVSQYSHTLTAGADGNLYAVSGGLSTPLGGDEILQLNPSTGAVMHTFTLESGAAVTAITAGADGNIWFTDENPGGEEVGELNPTSGAVSDYPITGYTFPTGDSVSIEPGPNGSVWFSAKATGGGPAIGEVTGLTSTSTTTTGTTTGTSTTGTTTGTTTTGTTTTGTSTPTTTQPAPTTGTLKAPKSASVSSKGVVALKLSCQGGTSAVCGGVAALRYKEPKKHGKKAKTLPLGSARFALTGGKSATVSVKLSSAGRKLLAAAKHHRLTVTATYTLPAHTSTGSVTLVSAKAATHKKKK